MQVPLAINGYWHAFPASSCLDSPPPQIVQIVLIFYPSATITSFLKTGWLRQSTKSALPIFLLQVLTSKSIIKKSPGATVSSTPKNSKISSLLKLVQSMPTKVGLNRNNTELLLSVFLPSMPTSWLTFSNERCSSSFCTQQICRRKRSTRKIKCRHN